MLYPLQTQEPNIDNVVTQVTQASVELAEAAANYGALKIIFGIFMVFIIIVVVLFVYQIFSLTKKMDIIHNAAVRTQEYFDGASDRTIGRSQAQILIRRGMNSLSNTIKYRILRIRLENHIDEVELTKNKINRVVKNDFIEFTSYLSNFLCDEKQLSVVVDEQDVDVIVDFITEQVYIPKDEFTVSGLDQSTDILVNGIKLSYLKNL
jgi:hypothetical protein